MTQMSLYDRCDFLRIHAIRYYREALPGQPASPQCSSTCCAWCLWILCCFSTPKQTSCLRVCPSPAFLAQYAAFLYSTTLFCRVISHPYSEESWSRGIGVTRFTRVELKRIAPLLLRTFYIRIIYRSVRIRGTTTARGLWIHARVHRMA